MNLRRRLPPLAALLLLALAAPVFAWGDETHKAITRGAITVLPAEMRPFFIANTEYLAAHSLDPDYIPNRTPAQRAEHFLDLDLYGAPPFAELPRDLAEARKKFGEETVIKRGLLPWTVQREYDRLVKALRGGDWPEARMAAAFLSHFVADTHMPLHATANYDGQATNQRGIHFRVEDELMARYHAGRVAPAAVAAIAARPVDWAFDELARSFALCAPLLAAELKAREAAPLDSAAYYAELHRRTGALLAARVSEAASALAAFYAAAWNEAGRPQLPPARAAVLISEAPLGGAPYAQRIAALLRARMNPFDALAHLATASPKRQWRFTVPFRAAGDESDPESFTTPTAGLREAAVQAVNTLRQFPAADRRVVIVGTGKNLAPALAEAAKVLSEEGATTLVGIVGAGDDELRAAAAATSAQLRIVRAATPEELPPLLAAAWTAALDRP